MRLMSMLLRPLDAVHWGPPQTNEAGETHYVRTVFPPSPRTIQGVIRTRLLEGADPRVDLGPRADKHRIAGLVGKPEQLPEGWQIRGPFPVDRPPDEPDIGVPYFRLPPFFGVHKAKDDRRKVTVFGRAREIRSDHPCQMDGVTKEDERPWLVGHPGAKKSKGGAFWVDGRSFSKLMLNQVVFGLDPDIHGWEHLPPFAKTERQVGIRIDEETGTAEDEMLYTLEKVRFRSTSGLWCSLEADLQSPLRASSLAEGVVSMGRKAALVEMTAAPMWPREVARYFDGAWIRDWVNGQMEDQPLTLWAVLLTPGRLEDAGSWLRLDRKIRVPAGMTLVERAAWISDARTIGGFNMLHRKPVENQTYADAGSAWVVQLVGGTAGERRAVMEQIHNRTLVGDNNETAMGFGHLVLGPAGDVPAAGWIEGR